MNLPNKLTMLRIILIPVFLVLVLVDRIPMHYLWSLIVFLAACITDTLDGNIARKRNLVTDFGKLMDPLADKLLVMSALVAFIPVAGVPVWVVVVILGREFMVTSLRLIAAGKGVVIAADKWGKVKTISQMVWLNYTLLMLWLFPGLGVDPLCGADGHRGSDNGTFRRQLYAEKQGALQRPVSVDF